MISFQNQSNFTGRNSMHVAVDDKHYSYYAYDYSGGVAEVESRAKLA
ncbi:MAG: hypothetical protein J6P74_05790 [Paludibacteraceae bacterium]|nr:hypothetical protein [Paludibacteraceae bacterium]